MLEELGVPYENIQVMPVSRGVQKYNKTGKVPVLLEFDSVQQKDPSFVLYESVAINTYLGDKYGGTNQGLVPPTGTRERATYDQTVCFILSEMDAQGLWIHRKHDTNAMAKFFGDIPEAVVAAQKQFDRINDELATQLNPYLLGKTFTAADILYVHCLDWAKSIGWHGSWPENVEGYRQLCHDRPAYQKAKALRDMDKEKRTNKSGGGGADPAEASSSKM